MSNIIAAGFASLSADGGLESLEEDLRKLADIGAEAVELALTSLDLVVGGRVIPEVAERLVALTRQFGFRYTVHGVVASNLMDPKTCRYQIDAAKALAELCDRIGARVLVQHSGHLRADQLHDRAGAEEREREALIELAEFCRPYGVRIALENLFAMEPGQWRQSPSEVAQTVREIGHPNLVALIDFSHAYLECTSRELDFREQLRAMAPVAGHLHLHDSFGRPQGFHRTYLPQEDAALGLGDLHLPLGWGDIEWDDIFKELTFLPETILILEMWGQYRRERPRSLAKARDLIALNDHAQRRASE